LCGGHKGVGKIRISNKSGPKITALGGIVIRLPNKLKFGGGFTKKDKVATEENGQLT
jgi:hypothetical protein